MKVKDLKNYQLAKNHFIDFSTGDPTSILAKEHGLIGLTRVMSCMEKLGLNAEQIDLIALPDFTYTRNMLRWNAGFPYGCVIKFGKDLTPFIPLDFRPNCCGIVLAEMDSFDGTPEMLHKRYLEVINSYSAIDKSDLNRRNHFMGFYYYSANEKNYFLIHGSFNFVKDALYYERNEELINASKTEFIMGEPFSYLIDNHAKEYYSSYLEHERLTMYYRSLIAQELFPHAEIRFNRTHEGFHDIHTLLLGAYADTHPFSCPIMLAPEVDLPFIDVTKSLCLHDGSEMYFAPHGGGYALYAISGARRLSNDSYTDYLLTYPNGLKMLTDNVLDMPFTYRENTVHYWCNKFHMAQELCRMTPIFNLKI